MRFISVITLIGLCVSLSTAQDTTATQEAVALLNVFVGEWQGSASAFFPRQQGKEPRRETVSVVSRRILKDTYVECDAIWTQANGDSRELFIYWNYNAKSDSFQILFLYDDWPGKVNYPLYYDSTKRSFTGYDTFIARGGIAAQERVEWYISEDGNEIRGFEYNHYQTDPGGYWPKSFEYVWKRK